MCSPTSLMGALATVNSRSSVSGSESVAATSMMNSDQRTTRFFFFFFFFFFDTDLGNTQSGSFFFSA